MKKRALKKPSDGKGRDKLKNQASFSVNEIPLLNLRLKIKHEEVTVVINTVKHSWEI